MLLAHSITAIILEMIRRWS